MKMKKFWLFFSLFFAVAALLALAFVFYTKTVFEKKEEVKPPAIFSIHTEGLKNIVLIQDKNQKTWSIVDYETKIDLGAVIATYGENSAGVFKIGEGMFVSLGGDSSIKISEDKSGKEVIDLLYGCVGKKEAGEGKKELVNCSDKNMSFRSFDPLETYESYLIKNSLSSPCGEIFEVGETTGTSVISLNAAGTESSLKLFQLASDKDFKEIIFELKAYWNTVKTTPLNPGKYYWRLMSGKNLSIASPVCSIDVFERSKISVSKPKNQDTISDGSIEFEFNSDDNSAKYTLFIVSGASGTAQIAELKDNKYIIDDPLQTLGPGSYFWYVKDKKDNFSTPRSFYIMTGQDIVLEKPAKNETIDSSKKFFPVIWAPIPRVKSYGIAISSNPSFVSIDYANTTDKPFVFVPMLKEGEYFLKISALFDSNKKISTDAIPFSIKRPN